MKQTREQELIEEIKKITKGCKKRENSIVIPGGHRAVHTCKSKDLCGDCRDRLELTKAKLQEHQSTKKGVLSLVGEFEGNTEQLVEPEQDMRVFKLSDMIDLRLGLLKEIKQMIKEI